MTDLDTEELQRAVDEQLDGFLDKVADGKIDPESADIALLLIGQLRLLTQAVRGVEQSLDAALEIRTMR